MPKNDGEIFKLMIISHLVTWVISTCLKYGDELII